MYPMINVLKQYRQPPIQRQEPTLPTSPGSRQLHT